MRRPSPARLAIGLGVIFVLAAGSGTLWFDGVRRLRDDAALTVRAQEAIGAMEALVSRIREAEAIQRTYVITGDERLLASLEEAVTEARRQVERIGALTAGSTRQQERIADLRTRIVNGTSVLTQTAGVRRDQGFEAARELVVSAAGLKLLDNTEGLLRLMQRDERAALTLRAVAADRAYRRAVSVGAATTAASLVVLGLFGWLVARHVSAGRHLERTLDRQRRQLRATLASIPDGVITTDDAGRVTFMNDTAERLTGWPRAEASHLPLEQVFVLVEEASGQPIQNLALRAMTMGGVGGGERGVLVSRDGRKRPLSDSAAPIHGTGGQVAGAVLLFRTATERATGGTPVVPVEPDEELGFVSERAIVAPEPARSTPRDGAIDPPAEVAATSPARGVSSPVANDDEDAPASRNAAARAQTAAAWPITPVTAAAAEAQTILIADEDRETAEDVALLLTVGGHRVRTAHSGLDALAAGAALEPSVVVLDMGLPGLDGFEVARRMREQAWSAQALFVAVSTWGTGEDAQRREDAGFAAHMAKPVDPVTLQAVIAARRLETGGPPRAARAAAGASVSTR